MSWRVEHGDCIAVMRALPKASIDAIVTDPPYGLGFMGQGWDTFDPTTLAKRVGVRDGNGPPSDVRDGRSKGRTSSAFANPAGEAGACDVSLRGSRAFQAWCEDWAREALRTLRPGGYLLAFGGSRTYHRLVTGIEDAGFEVRDSLQWLFGSGFPKSLNVGHGRGTALKPGHEPILLARAPLRGTVAANLDAHGTGALNIDACRIAPTETDLGRWPSNVLLDEAAAVVLDEQSGQLLSGANPTRRSSDKFRDVYGDFTGQAECVPARGTDLGGASRFFYCAKASRGERDAGLSDFPLDPAAATMSPTSTVQRGRTGSRRVDDREYVPTPRANQHPTVKPIALMRWLVRLVTPPGGVVLDPFTGSGTTGVAAVLEDVEFIGIEREASYASIARARIAHWKRTPWIPAPAAAALDGQVTLDELLGECNGAVAS